MPKILVIEDEKEICEAIVDTLEFADYDVYMASDGVQGIAAAKEIVPDLVICDVMMPELDGYGVLLQMNQIPTLAQIPFIFLTARASRADIRQGMNLGADDYITKPFTAVELLDAVQVRLQKSALQSLGEQSVRRQNLIDYVNLTLPHELRTPLTGIVGYLYLLKECLADGDLEAVQQMIESMERSAAQLGGLIDRYIAYAQVRALAIEPDLRENIHKYSIPLDLKDMIWQEAQQQAENSGRYQDLEFDLVSWQMTILSDHFFLVVRELVDNALKFSEVGTPIRLRSTIEDSWYIIEVENQGRGMTAAQIGTIGASIQFERGHFEQQGTGLGLAMVSHVAEIYDGTLEIQSVPGENLVAIFRLPIPAESASL